MLALLLAFHFFIPPSGWNAVHPKHLKSGVEVGFVSPARKTFHPSINLATEKISADLPTYVEALRRIHEADRTRRWIDLGYLDTQAGKAHLAQIDMRAQWGEVRSLQLAFVQEGVAYLLTAVTSKEDAASFHRPILESFSSFTVRECAEDTLLPEEKKSFQLLCQKASVDKKKWAAFEKELAKQFGHKGLHWAAKAAEETLLKNKKD